MHILFGFKQTETEVKIIDILKQHEIEVEYTERETKGGIKAYLDEHKDCTTAILRECMGSESYSANELAELTDSRDINIILITNKSNKGTEFMQILYAAGITGAILVDEKNGASAKQIAWLIMNKRKRKDARTYYGMKSGKVNLDILNYDTYVRLYTYLLDEDRGLNIVDRFIYVVNQLSLTQTVDFIRRLPIEVRGRLNKYEEFHLVLNTLREAGIEVKAEKPSNLIKGLTDEEFIRAIRGEKKTTSKEEKDVKKEGAKGKVEKESTENPGEAIKQNVFFNEEPKEKDEDVKKDEEPAEKQEEAVVNPFEGAIEKDEEEEKPKKRRSINKWKLTAYITTSMLIITVVAFAVFLYFKAF
jgi:hypothetical protein